MYHKNKDWRCALSRSSIYHEAALRPARRERERLENERNVPKRDENNENTRHVADRGAKIRAVHQALSKKI
jgi:hypothetical protein